jgi:hypothetical protein
MKYSQFTLMTLGAWTIVISLICSTSLLSNESPFNAFSSLKAASVKASINEKSAPTLLDQAIQEIPFRALNLLHGLAESFRLQAAASNKTEEIQQELQD